MILYQIKYRHDWLKTNNTNRKDKIIIPRFQCPIRKSVDMGTLAAIVKKLCICINVNETRIFFNI